MPRLPSDVWKHFRQETNSDHKKPRVVCIYCRKELLANATRAASHIKNCPGAPLEAQNETFSKKKGESKDNYDAEVSSDDYPRASRPSNAFRSSNGKRKSHSSAPGIRPNFGPRIEDINSSVARMAFATGIPFSVIEHPAFTSMIKTIARVSNLPTRQNLADSLLEKEFSTLSERTTTQVAQASSVTLATSGWGTDAEDPLVTYTAMTPRPVFYRSHARDEDHTSPEGASEAISKVIEDIGPNKIVSVVSDGEHTSSVTSSLLAAKYPQISFYACATTSLISFLETDLLLTPLFKSLGTNAARVVSFFRDTDIAKSVLRQKLPRADRSPLLLIPSERKHWVVYHDMFKALNQSRAAVTQAVDALDLDKLVPSDVRSIVRNEEFWAQVTVGASIFELVGQFIHNLQSESATVSQVFHIYRELKSFFSVVDNVAILPGRVRATIIEKIDQRWQMVYHPVMQLAYLLDPRYAGVSFSNEEYAQTLRFLKDRMILEEVNDEETADICAEVVNFRGRAGRFTGELPWDVAKKTDPCAWWNSFAGDAPRKLLDLVYRLMAMKPSCRLSVTSPTAARNRSPATAGFLQESSFVGNLPSVLQCPRAAKLIFIYESLALEYFNVTSNKPSWFTEFELLEFDGAGEDDELEEEDEERHRAEGDRNAKRQKDSFSYLATNV